MTHQAFSPRLEVFASFARETQRTDGTAARDPAARSDRQDTHERVPEIQSHRVVDPVVPHDIAHDGGKSELGDDVLALDGEEDLDVSSDVIDMGADCLSVSHDNLSLDDDQMTVD